MLVILRTARYQDITPRLNIQPNKQKKKKRHSGIFPHQEVAIVNDLFYARFIIYTVMIEDWVNGTLRYTQGVPSNVGQALPAKSKNHVYKKKEIDPSLGTVKGST